MTSVRTFLSIAILILRSIHTCNHIYCNSRNNVCKSIILVDGAWSGWASWSDCDVTCDSGTQSRGRSCDNPAPANGGDVCSGSAVETTQCTLDTCPGNAPIYIDLQFYTHTHLTVKEEIVIKLLF